MYYSGLVINTWLRIVSIQLVIINIIYTLFLHDLKRLYSLQNAIHASQNSSVSRISELVISQPTAVDSILTKIALSDHKLNNQFHIRQ